MDAVLALALGAQVNTVALSGVGVQRAHVQQALHTGRDGRVGHHGRKLGMHVGKAKVRGAPLVEDANQVDDDIGIPEVWLQGVAIEHAGLDELHVPVDLQVPVPFAATSQDGNAITET